MRHGPILCAATLALAAVAGSAAARAFDLQCDDERYRIDLEAKRWCRNACEDVATLNHNGGRTVLLLTMSHFNRTYDLRTRVMTFEAAGDTFRTRCRVLTFSGLPAGTASAPQR